MKAGAPQVSAPVYSHLAYDIIPGERQTVQRPDVLILEGINVLQPNRPGASRWRISSISRSTWTPAPMTSGSWFLGRLRALRETAFTYLSSAFRRLTWVSAEEVDAFGTEVWRTVNEVNLIENIQPTQARATLVLHKTADHTVTGVRLRRF